MPTSMQSDTLLIPPEAEAISEEAPSPRGARSAFQPIALSPRARERLRVLNRVLGADFPRPADERSSNSEVTIVE
jgi:hypothetical protein